MTKKDGKLAKSMLHWAGVRPRSDSGKYFSSGTTVKVPWVSKVVLAVHLEHGTR